MRRLLILALLAAFAATLLPAGPANARVVSDTTIVLGRSIGQGVLGSTRTKLERKLGDGAVVKRVRNDLGTFVTVRYAGKHLDVTYRGSTAMVVLTKDGRYGTTKGLGVGAAQADLKRAYPSIRCPNKRLCTLGRVVPGGRVTDFRLTRSKVISVSVGIVPD